MYCPCIAIMATDLRPTVGHRFTFRSDPAPWWDGVVRCEVLELEPRTRLSQAA